LRSHKTNDIVYIDASRNPFEIGKSESCVHSDFPEGKWQIDAPASHFDQNIELMDCANRVCDRTQKKLGHTTVFCLRVSQLLLIVV
jgi:hypothetical protein